MSLLILDTSFLVAILHQRDEFHSWAVATLKAHSGRLATCEAVLAESFHLLRNRGDAPKWLLSAIASDRISIPLALANEAAGIAKLMQRYRNVPMSLADACLVRMSELHNDSLILTLDADFKIYRRNNRQVIPIVTPSR